MLIRLLIIGVCSSLAFADAGFQEKETMSNVMVIVNTQDFLDSDSDGIFAWQEFLSVVDSVSDELNEPCYVCSTKTRYYVDNSDYPQAIPLDWTSRFLDTNRVWVPFTGVSLVTGDHYLLSKFAQCARAAETLTGVYPKYFCFGPGMPRLIWPNSAEPRDGDPNDTPYPSGSAYDSTVCKSLCDFTELYFSPSCDTVFQNVSYAGYWGSRYNEAARDSKLKGFVPGVYYQYKSNGGEPSDSTLQWVICTQIDGFDDNDICDMFRRAYRGRYQGWSLNGTPNHWAVVDGGSEQNNDLFGNSTVDGYSRNTAIWSDFRSAFTKDKILWDNLVDFIDTTASPDETLFVSVGGIPDTIETYFGYSGGQTLSSGYRALFYCTAGSYHELSLNIPDDYIYQTNLVLADGCVMITYESWNCYSFRDSSWRAGDDQSLMTEWFDDAGLSATYGVGNTREVSLATAVSADYLVDAMFSPEVPFAVVGTLASVNKAQNIRMGWPSFAWSQGMVGTGEQVTSVGGCSGAVTYTGYAPQNADSVFGQLEFQNGTTQTTPKQNCGAGEFVSIVGGTRWVSPDVVTFTIVYQDVLGRYHSRRIEL